MGPGIVAQACNPSYFRGGDLKIAAQGMPKQKVCETSSQPMAGPGGAHLSS
jgi:hypothetical protein